MILLWIVATCYRRTPQVYLEIAKLPFRRNSPEFLDQALSGLGENYWPLILWMMSQQYVQEGGVAKYPQSRWLENAILVDAAGRHHTPGPIRDQVEAMLLNGQMAIESLSEEHKGWLLQLVQPVLDRDRRLALRLDPEDLAQEALLLLQEFMNDPAVNWNLPRSWTPDEFKLDEGFPRKVLARLMPRKYGTDKQVERNTFDCSDPELLTPLGLDAGFGNAETRWELEELMDHLPAKQLEAVEINLLALREGVSLEEMARRRGLNPQRIRESFKAVQRRFLQ